MTSLRSRVVVALLLPVLGFSLLLLPGRETLAACRAGTPCIENFRATPFETVSFPKMDRTLLAVTEMRALRAALQADECGVAVALEGRHAVYLWQNPSLHIRTFSSECVFVTGNEFIRKLKALGKAQNVTVTLNASRGKGSHPTLYYASAFTVVRNPKDELKTGTFRAMCRQLGIKPNDL